MFMPLNLRASNPYFSLKASAIAIIPSPNLMGSILVFTETSTDMPASRTRPFICPPFLTDTFQIAIVVIVLGYGSHGESDTGCAIKRGHNALLVLSFGKALVSPESRLKQKQPAPPDEDTRPALTSII